MGALPEGLRAFYSERHLEESSCRTTPTDRRWKQLSRTLASGEQPLWTPSAPTEMAPQGRAKGFLCPLLSRHPFTNTAEAAGKSKPQLGVVQPLIEIKSTGNGHSPSPIRTRAEIYSGTFCMITSPGLKQLSTVLLQHPSLSCWMLVERKHNLTVAAAF